MTSETSRRYESEDGSDDSEDGDDSDEEDADARAVGSEAQRGSGVRAKAATAKAKSGARR